MTDHTPLFEKLKKGPWKLGRDANYATAQFKDAGCKEDGSWIGIHEPTQAIAREFQVATENISLIIFGKTLDVSIRSREAVEHMRNAGFEIPHA